MEQLEILKNYLEQSGYENISYLTDKFSIYYRSLLEWNSKFNLTAITDISDIQIKHFIDSIAADKFIKDFNNVCDIGCGAGFPGIPLAILNPNVKFTLVDSVNKKISFINHIISQLNLHNVTALHSRAEDFAKNNFQKFDCGVARAVATLPTLAEYIIPLIKINGYFIAYKGKNYQEEIESANKIIKILNSHIEYIYQYQLAQDEQRYLISIKKLGKCPDKYPRGGNKPRLQPIL